MEIDPNSIAFAGLLITIAGLTRLLHGPFRDDSDVLVIIQRDQDDEEGCWS